jgi:glycosyltransferase involved in cell wall biosynthesis
MPSTKLHAVMHVVASFSESDGGPARYIAELCGELAGRGHAITLLTTTPATGALMKIDARVRVQALPSDAQMGSTATPQRYSRSVTEWVNRHPGGLLHFHGLWRATMHQAAAAARKTRRPVVWAPMGMLEPWALQHRGWKKKLAWWMYQRRDLAGATVMHATSRLEADSVRRTGLKAPITIIPLGVAVPPAGPAERSVATVRTALFLSRIHPKKGLLMLLEAWASLRPPAWRLVIAGNDEGGHTAEVAAAIARWRLDGVVTMVGAAFGEQKERLFREAQLFILPSHSENFAVVVAEALVRELPVLTTTGTPWSEVAEKRAGWWVSPTVGPIRAALADATRRTPDELRTMGCAGAAWASTQFSWNRVTTQVEELYQWMAAEPVRHPQGPLFAEVTRQSPAIQVGR